jgi:hypothetical protein
MLLKIGHALCIGKSVQYHSEHRYGLADIMREHLGGLSDGSGNTGR